MAVVAIICRRNCESSDAYMLIVFTCHWKGLFPLILSDDEGHLPHWHACHLLGSVWIDSYSIPSQFLAPNAFIIYCFLQILYCSISQIFSIPTNFCKFHISTYLSILPISKIFPDSYRFPWISSFYIFQILILFSTNLGRFVSKVDGTSEGKGQALSAHFVSILNISKYIFQISNYVNISQSIWHSQKAVLWSCSCCWNFVTFLFTLLGAPMDGYLLKFPLFFGREIIYIQS